MQNIIIFFSINLVFISISVRAADHLGRGYNSKEQEFKENPIEDLEFAWGPMSGELDILIECHSHEKTRNIIAQGGASIGFPVLGAEISGQLNMVDKNSEEYFSGEFKQEWSQIKEIKKYKKSDYLTKYKMSSKNVNFFRKYGDKICWSQKTGGKFRLLVVMRYKSHLNENRVHFEAKLNLLFNKIRIAKLDLEERNFLAQFDFDIFIKQECGDKEKLDELCRACRNQREFGEICHMVLNYMQDDYPQQINQYPYIQEKNFICYDDSRILPIF